MRMHVCATVCLTNVLGICNKKATKKIFEKSSGNGTSDFVEHLCASIRSFWQQLVHQLVKSMHLHNEDNSSKHTHIHVCATCNVPHALQISTKLLFK